MAALQVALVETALVVKDERVAFYKFTVAIYVYIYIHTYILYLILPIRLQGFWFGGCRSLGFGDVGLRVAHVQVDLGVSENRGTLFWGPYNKDPTI